MDPNVLPWWAWLLIGVALWFVVNNFVLPDSWSTWLGQRRNGLTALLPFAVLALLVGFGNLLWALGAALLAALQQTAVAPWVWWLVIIGVVLVALYALVRRISRPVARRTP